ncbi:MAG TPA: hypothetical protein VGN15_12595 [Ktedonobacteraceae bacterium]|jgi:hypothetical protein|nr:hypothetical protein [Ktedonobacteraceae bacterium]
MSEDKLPYYEHLENIIYSVISKGVGLSPERITWKIIERLGVHGLLEPTIRTSSDHDCTDGPVYAKLYNIIARLKAGTRLSENDVEAMQQAHVEWVAHGEENCNSFREAFNAGFAAARHDAATVKVKVPIEITDDMVAKATRDAVKMMFGE